MTPEELQGRVERLYKDLHFKPQEQWREVLLLALSDAAEDAWGACVELAEELEATYQTAEPNPGGPGQVVSHRDFAARLRNGGLGR